MIRCIKQSKKLLITILILAIIIATYGIYREFNPIVIKSSSDLFVPENVNELKENSDLIVKVKTSNSSKEYIEYMDDGTPIYGHTLTQVVIQEVLAESDSNTSAGSTISICEPYYHYRVFGVQNYLMIIEDYKPMISNTEYILFLRNASNIGANVYYMVGNEYGQYIVKKNNENPLLDNNQNYIQLYKEVTDVFLANIDK